MVDDVEVDFEPEEELGDLSALKAKLAKVKKELEVCKTERQEYLDGWQRCKADSVNARKDSARDAERRALALRDDLIYDLIPALDSFDMATGSAQWESLESGWRAGMEHIRNQILEALQKAGVERIGKVGEAVDHALHDILEERDDVPGEPGTVARIVRYGYKREQVLRPAQVIVKKPPQYSPTNTA